MHAQPISATDQVWHRQLSIYARQVPTMIMGYFLACILMTVSLWQSANHELLLSWFFSSFVFVFTPFIMGKLYTTRNHLLSQRNWRLFFSSFALLAGTHWGLSLSLFADLSDTIHLTLMTILTLGVLSGALYGMSLLPPAYFLFLVPVMIQFIMTIIPNPDFYSIAVAALGLAALLTWLSYQLYVVNSETLLLYYQNARLSQTLQHEKEEIEQASRTKTQFIAAVSHDLRQPLQAQRLFAEAINTQSSDKDMIQLSQYILDSQSSMQSMLDTLLDISRLNTGTIKPKLMVLPLADLFRTLEQEFMLAAQKQGLLLVIHWPPNNAFILSDRALLMSILRNLLSNAIRYTKQGCIMLAARRRGEYWRIEVRDSGIGIPTDKQKYIFGEFQQLGNPERDQAKGLGLGLSIVQRLCALMFYPIELRSCPNHGSTFAIQIPALDDVSIESTHHDQELHLANLESLRVLVVDDDQAIRQGLKHSLTCYGLDVISVATIAEAKDAQQNKQPDIIITDYRLANHETGMMLIQQLRQSTKHVVPTIIITGDTDPCELQTFNKSHDVVLHKPVSILDLLFEIQRLLRL